MDQVRLAPDSTFATYRAIERADAAGVVSMVDGRICVEGVPVVYSERSAAALRAAEAKRARKAARLR